MKHFSSFSINKKDIPTVKKYDSRNECVISYYNIECGFDIETSSTMIEDKKQAFMYIWAFGIGKDIYYGRTWKEFIKFCGLISRELELSNQKILTCYIHNLGYEFQFMRKYLNWLNVFSVDERKPIKALCSLGIEFKCSYILSSFSLANLAKNLVSHKIGKLEDFNYSLVRTHETELTEKELKYLKYDVLIILYYINEQIKYHDNNISKIPLTNTGRVRNFVRNKCFYTDKNHKKSSKGKYKRYRELMNELTLTDKEYYQLKRAFMGGFTHASSRYSGKLLEGVTSIDFSSSYPAVMLTEKFPMSKPTPVDLQKESFKELIKSEYGLLFDVKFENIHSKLTYETYISEGKCRNVKKPIINNGRIFKAESLTTTITSIDFEIIQECYEWENMQVSNCKKFYMQYLPKDFILAIIELYEKKTVLKDVAGMEVEYMVSKGMLNSTYGMCVTDIVRDEISYDGDWKITPLTLEGILEAIRGYNENSKRFLYYPWGVWITAYARKNLWNGILNIKDDYVYSDTDSIKFLNYDKHKNYIEWYNKRLRKKLEKMCNFRKIDIELLYPRTKDGIIKPIGVWDFDGFYTHFKTLGSKRYLVRYESGKLALTVAGLSKQNGIKYMERESEGNYLKVFEMFNDDLYIPDTETGKMTHTYIDTEFMGKIMDFKGKITYVESKSSIHLAPCDFTLSLSKQYMDFLNNLRKGYIYNGLKTI